VFLVAAGPQRGGEPVKLMRVRMQLGRTPDHPEGDHRHGYLFVAPLAADAYLDAEAWPEVRGLCWARRFDPDMGADETANGWLQHSGRGWRFEFSGEAGEPEDKEPLFKLDRHRVAVGDYISVTEPDGVQRPFRIVEVTPA
jgi:hypothetical protein